MRKDLVGPVLLQERKNQRKTIQMVADTMEIGTTTVSSIERGLPNVADDKYIHYAKLLGKAETLFGIIDDMTQRERIIMQEFLHIEDILTAVPKTALQRLDDYTDLHLFRDAHVLAMFLRGRVYFEQKNYEKAKEQLEKTVKALDQCPSLSKSNLYSICYNDLGRIAFYDNDYEKARKLTEDAIQAFVDNGERNYYKPYLYLNQAIYLEELKRIEESCQLLEQLLSNFDSFKTNLSITIQVFERYANLLKKLGMPLKALKYAQDALQIAWENHSYKRLFSVWSTMASILVSLGRLDEAKVRYLKALDLCFFVRNNSDLIADAYYGLGKLLIETKEYEKAEKQFCEAVGYLEKSSDMYAILNALCSLGWVQLQLKKYTLAKNTFDKIKSIHSSVDEQSMNIDNYIIMCEFYNSIGDKVHFKYYQNLAWSLMKGGV